MRIAFHGAARSVTGSRHLLEAGGRRILLDCGLFQGRRRESYERNTRMGFDPAGIDAVLLSHAHIDHSGALPALVRNGYAGPVHATPATADLARVMLLDSAHIQERDVQVVNRREGREGARARRPLYTVADAEETGRRFEGHPYGRPFPVADGVTAAFHDAGHILGSAIVSLEVAEGGRRSTVVFSGDLGRDCLPIVGRPDPPPRADVLLLETTYGNREHPPPADIERELAGVVNRAAERRGKILIPAFSVGRTQQITYMLNNLANEGRIADVPVFVDSPLALQATEVFRRHPECWEPEMARRLRESGDGDPFGFDRLRYLRTPEESKRLNDFDGPAIIIAASGMCENGRILHHLANHLPNGRNTVLIVGYQAEATLGRRLVEGAVRVFIYGREVERRAEILRMNALSAHAGRGDLEAFVRGFGGGLRRLFLVHGEPAQSEPFAGWARQATPAEVRIPGPGEEAEV